MYINLLKYKTYQKFNKSLIDKFIDLFKTIELNELIQNLITHINTLKQQITTDTDNYIIVYDTTIFDIMYNIIEKLLHIILKSDLRKQILEEFFNIFIKNEEKYINIQYASFVFLSFF
jgi:hypothetical protein